MSRRKRVGLRTVAATTLLVACAVATPALAVLGPQYFDYQVKLPPSPIDATDAIRTLDDRNQAVLAAIACGDQLAFARDRVAHEADENTTSRLMAKIEWGAGHVDSQMHARVSGGCRFSRTFRWLDFANKEVCALIKDATTCISPDEGSSDKKKKDAAEAFEKAAREAVADMLWAELVNGNLSTLKEKILNGADGGRGCHTEFVSTNGSDGTAADRSIAGWRRLDPLDEGRPEIDPAKTTPVRGGAIQIDFAISQSCLLSQAAQGLSSLVIPVRDGEQQRAGTNGTPCHGLGTIYGDWDMAERNLIRIAFLIRKYGLAADGQVLQNADTHLRDDLLTLDRGLEGDSHNVWFGCGNSTGHSGSAEDRAIDRGGHGNPPGDALGDLGWFLLMLAILLALLALGMVIAAGLGAGLGMAAAAAVVGAALVGVLLINIPETENHLLGINTTKYLNNQLIIETLGNDLGMTAPYIQDNIEIKAWLLKRMQGFLQHDFIEFNAHPYQRHSIESIRNLFDFAGDPGRPTMADSDLRNAAQLVLNYTAAKFALGSSQGRRMVPYRRHRSDLPATIDAEASGWNGMYDLSGGADHQVGLGLLYSGQTQQLPLGQASRGFAAEVINAATSTFVPETTILDLAIVRDTPIYQRISHTTQEIYSSGAGYLVSAGGLATPLAYPVTGIAAIDGHKDDWGSGVPTTLFLNAQRDPDLGFLGEPLSGDPKLDAQRTLYADQQKLAGPGRAPPVWIIDHAAKPIQDGSAIDGIYAKYLSDLAPDAQKRNTLGEFIRIKGAYDVDTDSDGNKLATYDNNLCVWDGFACGTNIELGPMATDCDADVATPPWIFIDTTNCKGRKSAPRTLIVVFKKDCPSGQGCTNYGFFEVIDADAYGKLSGAAAGEDLFKKFRDQITSANTALLALAAGTNMVADYHSARAQKLEFSCWGHETDSDTWGVYHVDNVATHDLGAWPFAGGEWSGSASLLRPEVQTPMRSVGNGTVEITSPRLRSLADPTKFRVLRLDFSDRDHPKSAADN
ncbi:hypothetical protein [Roseateles sp.]|uniref:hypothetical protein n=1 Tax=Roseateles sp. TaxID=1971397 RepID=UPI0026011879|nr:hypothetical protein [Roseateles sp.]MBV8033653.1 hypothetical protein [Roseateles sp.]